MTPADEDWGDAEEHVPALESIAVPDEPLPWPHQRPQGLEVSPPDARRVAYGTTWMSFLSFLFLALCLGQWLAHHLQPWWLPPPSHWQQGFLPYQWLLAGQFVLLLWMFWATWQSMMAKNSWWSPKRKWAVALACLAVLEMGGLVACLSISAFLPAAQPCMMANTPAMLFHLVIGAHLAGLAWIFSPQDTRPW